VDQSDRAIALIRERLDASASPERIPALLADLDSDEYAVRERATQELEALGKEAELSLRALLSDPPSAEVRSRVIQLLEVLAKAGDRPSGKALRTVRAIGVLESVADGPARELLEELARGAPNAPATREAKKALERLGRRRRAR
jgi:hypothetical protein